MNIVYFQNKIITIFMTVLLEFFFDQQKNIVL